jgi:hypothetical protein
MSEVKILQEKMFELAEKFKTNLANEMDLQRCKSDGSSNCMNGACHFCVRLLRANLIRHGSRFLADRGRGIHVVTLVDNTREIPVGTLNSVDPKPMCREILNALRNIAEKSGKKVLAIGAVEACLNDRQSQSCHGTTYTERVLTWAPHAHFVVTGCTKKALVAALQEVIPRPQQKYHSPLRIEFATCTTRAISYATKRNTTRRVTVSIDGQKTQKVENYGGSGKWNTTGGLRRKIYRTDSLS